MALFTNRPESKDAPAQPMNRQRPNTSPAQAPVGQINMIGQGAVIEGTLQVSGDIRIGGRVVGEVDVEGKLITTEEGLIEGDVRTTSGDIAGTLKGSIAARERLILRSNCRIEGDIRTPKLVIEEGAVFTGKCEMSDKSGRKGTPASSGSTSGASSSPSSSSSSSSAASSSSSSGGSSSGKPAPKPTSASSGSSSSSGKPGTAKTVA